MTAASLALDAGGAVTRTQTAAAVPYSVDADSSLKPGLEAAFGGKGNNLGLEADISSGLQFSLGVGYDPLTESDANALIRWFETNQGGNPITARANNPDSETFSIGAWINGDVSGSSGTVSASGSATLGWRMDLQSGQDAGDHIFVDLTGSGTGDMNSLFGGLNLQGGGSSSREAVLTLDTTPGDSPTPTGISVEISTESLTESQLKGAAKLGALPLSGSVKTQTGVITDVIVQVAASDSPQVVPALEILAEAALADSSGGPSDAAVSQAVSVLAANAKATVLQSTLTQGAVGIDVAGGDGLAWGVNADTTDLDKHLVYSAYSPAGSDTLSPWTACNDAITTPLVPLPGGTDLRTFEPWVAVGQNGAEASTPGFHVTQGGMAACESGSQDDPGSHWAVNCSPPGNGYPCFIGDVGGGDPGSPLLCSNDPASKELIQVSPSGAGVAIANLNQDNPRAPPWYLILADGRRCKHQGYGTDTALLRYDCGSGVGATVPDRSQSTWTVQEGIIQANPTPLPNRIEVVTAYR